jgi:hypothetical protein
VELQAEWKGPRWIVLRDGASIAQFRVEEGGAYVGSFQQQRYFHRPIGTVSKRMFEAPR